jgi:serine/threonine protein kinase
VNSRTEFVRILDQYLADLQVGRAPERAQLLACYSGGPMSDPPLRSSDSPPPLEPAALPPTGPDLHGEGAIPPAPDGPSTDVAETPAARRPSASGYEIVGELDRGGMGIVYLARQANVNRLVALKMILAGAHASEQDLARFRSEAEAIGRLQPPQDPGPASE